MGVSVTLRLKNGNKAETIWSVRFRKLRVRVRKSRSTLVSARTHTHTRLVVVLIIRYRFIGNYSLDTSKSRARVSFVRRRTITRGNGKRGRELARPERRKRKYGNEREKNWRRNGERNTGHLVSPTAGHRMNSIHEFTSTTTTTAAAVAKTPSAITTDGHEQRQRTRTGLYKRDIRDRRGPAAAARRLTRLFAR